jgi:hypothetical protein
MLSQNKIADIQANLEKIEITLKIFENRMILGTGTRHLC